MAKLIWKPGTMIYPLPALLISCGATAAQHNIITISWTGTICTEPALCYISVRPDRHSYKLIKDQGEYVINLTTRALAKATDWCGVRSGREHDKFTETGLTAIPAEKVKAPMIKESPVNIECRVRDILELGSHHMFISEVLTVHADEKYLDQKSGYFDLSRADPIAYSHGKYFTLGKILGKFGYTVQKKGRK